MPCFLFLQALDVIKQLKESMNIGRAQMRLAVTLPAKDAKRLQEKLKSMVAVMEEEEWQGGDLHVVSGEKKLHRGKKVHSLVCFHTNNRSA